MRLDIASRARQVKSLDSVLTTGVLSLKLSADGVPAVMDATRLHRVLLEEAPNEIQTTLYTNSYKGFRGNTKDEAKVVAVFVLALSLTRGTEGFQRVLMMVPPELEAWVWSVLRSTAKRMFAGMPRASAGARALKNAIEHVMLGCHKLDQEPPRWVAFGVGDATPPWMGPFLV